MSEQDLSALIFVLEQENAALKKELKKHWQFVKFIRLIGKTASDIVPNLIKQYNANVRELNSKISILSKGATESLFQLERKMLISQFEEKEKVFAYQIDLLTKEKKDLQQKVQQLQSQLDTEKGGMENITNQIQKANRENEQAK